MLSWLFSDPLPPGTAAPEFALPDQDGSLVRLSALRGRDVVLVFYPADDTPVCRKQLCEFRDNWQLAQARSALVFGINPRGKSHAAFRRRHGFPFPLLVDEGQKVGKLYQANGLFVPRRTVYRIDPEGVIRYAKRGKPSPEEVLAD